MIPVGTLCLVVWFVGENDDGLLQIHEIAAAFVASLSTFSMSRLLHGTLLALKPFLYIDNEWEDLQVREPWDQSGESAPWWDYLAQGLGYVLIPLALAWAIVMYA